MILSPDNPHYKDLPGLAVLLGGMWVMNVSYWGFNQYIIQRGLAAQERARGAEGHRARGVPQAADARRSSCCPASRRWCSCPDLERPDQAYPQPHGHAARRHLGPGVRGAGRGDRRVARDRRSIRSRPSSRWTCTARRGRRPSQKKLVHRRPHRRGGVAASSRSSSRSRCSATSTRPSSTSRNSPGFFTPGICVIFLLGMFWERTTARARWRRRSHRRCCRWCSSSPGPRCRSWIESGSCSSAACSSPS